ncbi:hypothetical protein BGW80DRAFT_1249862 [Lactifluus volemus]|nr:hypothetical protein BGW80DRAFT_1251820 [Lactifluus volemus]KAH9974794.1 hypothetical protein BGW80DRAFT_1251486 [Lactifluus volemus]KAH9977065.1 hypothetical protein BGW80DRAFT_1249862 [Lactifluus volemus]
MPITTRKQNAETHPGRVVLDTQKKRRTPQQILDDRMRAEAAAAEAAERAEATLEEIVGRINELEDEIQRDSQLTQKHATRPDLRHSGQASTQSKFMTRQMKHAHAAQVDASEQIDEEDSCSIYSAGWKSNRASPTAFYDDVSTVSPASFTDGESIIDVISNEEWDKRASECIEDDAVSAYVDDGVENEEDMGNVDKTVDKARPGAEIDDLNAPRDRATTRLTATPSPPPPAQPRQSIAIKRKVQANFAELDRAKRARTVTGANAGLLDDWKTNAAAAQLSKKGRSHVHSAPRPMAQEIDISTSSGSSVTMAQASICESHNEESEDVLGRVRARKSTVGQASRVAQSRSKGAALTGSNRVGGGRETAQMGIVLNQDPTGTMMEGNTKAPQRLRKTRYMTTDLPFPGPPNGENIKTWQNTVVPSLLIWAGTQADPFGANARMRGPLAGFWSSAFPDSVLSEHELDIVLSVAETLLNNWRSEIGKSGYRAIVDLWLEDPATFGNAEARAEYIEKALHGFKFIHKNPDAAKEMRATFCSSLIAKVERGLSAFKTGEDSIKAERNQTRINSKTKEDGSTASEQESESKVNSRVWSFSDNPWGRKTRSWVGTTRRLNDRHWAQVVEEAWKYLPAKMVNALNMDGDQGELVDLRACIDLDCVCKDPSRITVTR